MSLSFIPLEDLQEMLDNFMDNLDKSFVDFATYVESIYIHGRPTRGREQVVFPKLPS